MKKIILIVGLVVLALGVFGLGVVLAQGVQPPAPVGRGGMMGGYGSMHDYVEQALADKLGITEEDVEDALASGKTMYQIALDNGVKEADVASFLTEVHTAAFDKAVADGVITREQADFMLERMAGGFGYGRGMGGGQFGRDMMNNGGYGPMHDYVEEALAGKLSITEKDIEDALASGKTMYQIALDNGVKEADVATLLTEVHTAAFDKAVADGVITREQADFMLQRMTANGFNFGNCPMGQSGQYGQGNGRGRGMMGGGQYGPGGMMGGGRWGQQVPTAQP
jgi:uncharacterized protein YidB (DUF937 family)